MTSYCPSAAINCADKCWFCVPFVFQGVSNFCSDTLFKLQNITLVIKGVYYCGATRAIASNVPRSRFLVIIINDLYFKISWRVSTSLKARRIQWDSLKNKNRWNIHIQTTPMNSQARERRGRRDWNLSREPGGSTPIHYIYGYVPPKGVVILKLLI